MNNPIKHHYVPEVYLKRFSLNQDGDLFTLKVKKDYPTIAKMNNKSRICYEINRYKLNNVEVMDYLNINDPYIIEKECFKYENIDLETLFDKIDNRQKISQSEYKKLIRIIVDIKQRNPCFSKLFCSIDSNSIFDFAKEKEVFLKTFMSFCEKNGINDVNIEEIIEESFKRIQTKFNNHNYISNFYISGFYEINIITEELINELFKWEAMVLYTDYDNPFITSDNPGYAIDNKNEIQNTNFASAFHFIFPISPKSLLCLKKSQKKSFEIFKEILYHKVNPSNVISFNNSILLYSNQIIISQLKEQLEITFEFSKHNRK